MWLRLVGLVGRSLGGLRLFRIWGGGGRRRGRRGGVTGLCFMLGCLKICSEGLRGEALKVYSWEECAIVV